MPHPTSHVHAALAEDMHCQFRDIGHLAIPQPAPQVAMEAPAPIAGFEPPDVRALTVGRQSHTLTVRR